MARGAKAERDDARAGGTPVRIRLAGAALVLGVAAVYANALHAPFVFDDLPSIVANASIRRLDTAFFPPAANGETVGGRPILNLSFAINYALGGEDVAGYHAVNVAIHAACALLLFGIVRRTLADPPPLERWRSEALPIAFAAAAIWALHPLQTESVTYTAQRAESLAGLFGLLTLYAFVRAGGSPRGGRWLVLSVVSCLLGMGTKEVTVVVPPLVFLYDRTFVAGSFAEAWRTRRSYYVALGATLLPLALLVASTGGRGGSAGFGAGVAWQDYGLTQLGAVAHYVRLAFWPSPLVFDYGTNVVVRSASDVWPQGVSLALAAAAVLWALVRRPAAAYVGAWFFVTLAPTSSVMPIAMQPMAEHRTYLALAALALALVAVAWAVAGRRALPLLLALALVCGGLTVRRNGDYASAERLWKTTVAAAPDNVRAITHLALLEHERGERSSALARLERALAIDPADERARNAAGMVLVAAGRMDDAIEHFRQGLRHSPRSVRTRCNYAAVLTATGRAAEGATLMEDTLSLAPDSPDVHANLGLARLHLDQIEAAIVHLETSLALEPDQPAVLANSGAALARAGRFDEARSRYEAALRLRPNYALAREGLSELPGAAPSQNR